jgi:lysophospholipase L1-like esterase
VTAVLALAGLGEGSCPAAETAAGVTIQNRGVGGDSSRDGLRRFAADVEAARPQVLILYFGINDALNSAKLVGVDEFRANLQQMIDRARAVGVRVIILTTPNPIVAAYVRARHPTHPAPDLEAHLALYDAAVRDLAQRNGLPLADLHGAIAARAVPPEGADSLIRNQANSQSADGVHLTAEGYRLMAGLYAAILKDRIHPGNLVVCLGDSITFGAHMPGAGSAQGQTYPAWLNLLLNPPR